MDAIKKKMQSLKTETENAMARADQLDAEFRAATSLAEKTEESVGFPSIIWQRQKPKLMGQWPLANLSTIDYIGCTRERSRL